jgi:cellulose synthase/poly-beta-1,6-N-acetylglucosamine synthase-like glycosyltransferase
MLVFITSLKHPSTVASPDTMLRLLNRTLSTIEAQTCSDYRVIVVCHEIPQLSYDFAHVEYVLVDFPPPADDFLDLAYTAEVDRDEGQRKKRLELVKLDKGRKYLRGLYHARQYNPSHVMFFDADDCLSPNIVQTVLRGPKEKSWYVGNGYIYSE